MPWSILYIKDNLEWSLRSSNGFQPRNSNIEEGLPLQYCVGDGKVMTLAVSVDFRWLQSFNVARAARCCTPSILSMLRLVWGDHDEDTYSNCGRTKVLYAIALTWIGHFFVFLEIKTRVEVSPQGHRSVSESRHFLLQAPQCPCSVRKRFSRDHCCRGRSKPGCRIVGSHTRWELTTWANFQLCLHRLLMSTGCKYSHSGFLDVSRSNGGLRISGWIGQLSCLTIFSTSLSVAAFIRRAGGSMLESTGSHGRGVERRVPEMRRMVEFNCTVKSSSHCAVASLSE